MPRRKAKDDDFYNRAYDPSQDCDPEDSDQEYHTFCGKTFYDNLRKKAVPRAAAETHLGANERVKKTTSKFKPSPEIKEATKQTVGSTLPRPSNVRRCKSSEICLQARARSEEAKTLAICHCYTKIPTVPVSVDRANKGSRNVLAWLGILPAKSAKFRTEFIRFLQRLCWALYVFHFWVAIAYGILILLRFCGYDFERHLPLIHTKTVTK